MGLGTCKVVPGENIQEVDIESSVPTPVVKVKPEPVAIRKQSSRRKNRKDGVIYYPSQSAFDAVIWLRSVGGVPTYRGIKVFCTFDRYGHNIFKLLYLLAIIWPACVFLQVLCLPLFPLLMMGWFCCCSLGQIKNLKEAHNCKNWMRTLHIVIAEVVLALCIRSFLYVGEYNIYWAGHGVIVYLYTMHRFNAVFENSIIKKLGAIVLVGVLVGWHYRFDLTTLTSAVDLLQVNYTEQYERFDPVETYNLAYNASHRGIEAALGYDYVNSKHRHRRDTMLNWAILGLMALTVIQLVLESFKCVGVCMYRCICCRCCQKSEKTKDVFYESDGEEDEEEEEEEEEDEEDDGLWSGLTALQPMHRVRSIFRFAERPQLGPQSEPDYTTESLFSFIPKGPPTPPELDPDLQSGPPPALPIIDYNVPSVFTFIPLPPPEPVFKVDYNVSSVFSFIPEPPVGGDEVEDFTPLDDLDLVSLVTEEDIETVTEEESLQPESSLIEVRPPTPEPDPPTPEELREFSALAEAVVSDLKTLRQTAVSSVYMAQQQVVQLFAADCFDLCDRMKAKLQQMRDYQDEMTAIATYAGQLATKLWLAQHSAPPKRARQVRTDYFTLQDTAASAQEKGALLGLELDELAAESILALSDNVEHVVALKSAHEAAAGAMVATPAVEVSLVVSDSTPSERPGTVGPDGQVARALAEPITDVGGTWNKIRLPKVVYGAHTVKPPPKTREELEEISLMEHKSSITSVIKERLEARRVVEQAAADKEAAYLARFKR